MRIITLCGSTKFKREYERINAELSLQGNVVLSVGLFGKESNTPLTLREKNLLDSVHLTKIKMSDEIFVINVDGYIGESTTQEIKFAIKRGKIVKYLESTGLIIESVECPTCGNEAAKSTFNGNSSLFCEGCYKKLVRRVKLIENRRFG